MNDRRHSLLSPLVLLTLLGSIVVAVPVAAAQTAGIDQYQPNPGHDGGAGAGGDAEPGGPDGPAASGEEAPSAGTATPSGGDDPAGGGANSESKPDGDDNRGGSATPTSAGPAEGGIGDIPFTNYPMTPLLLAVILLLVAGVVARVATLAARRYRQSSAAS